MAPLTDSKRVVVKVGSALLVDAVSGDLRRDWVQGLTADIVALKAAGKDVVLVSSGSIALGRAVLGLPRGSLTLGQSQAAAAVGQIRLARAYEEMLAPHGVTTAQILLTLEDSADRKRYLNSRTTLTALLKHGVVPIVNENDTVATDEIRFGDNDRLAAQVAAMCGADLLVLLSDVDGIYTGDPRTDKNAQHLAKITEITPDLEAMAGDAGTDGAKGGMKTKVMAAKTAMQAGCDMVIMQGDQISPLAALSSGARHSLFAAKNDPQQARKMWIAAMKPKGDLIVDAGAARALGQGKSLLPAGVTNVVGRFGHGDLVRILDVKGAELARGLSNYDSAEAALIAGQHSGQIEHLLGYAGRSVLIHRDDMVI